MEIQSLQFDNSFTRELPADSERRNYRRQVTGACFSRVKPTPVSSPELIAYSREVADMLELPENFRESTSFVKAFSGNALLDGMDSYAACYGGHQFGNWAGQLGDGRAINLGEIVNSRNERFTLQLKGAGPTPYSRNADGLAVLRSSIREFLCSEAMHHLGVPTTRALSLVWTGDLVERDMFYDGRPKDEPGAIVCRVAPSFTRIGNFEIFSARKDMKLLKKLLDYTIRVDFSYLSKREGFGWPYTSEQYADWFREVCRLTADMIVHWMRVGFVHGVMNSDNMSVLGLTIDYGPYGWLENYDPDWTPNTTDASGRRYRFGFQPSIAHWNLARLADALLPLINDHEMLSDALQAYPDRFHEQWKKTVASKLGLRQFEQERDAELSDELFSLLSTVETDMTIFFRRLALLDLANGEYKASGSASIGSSVSDFTLPEQLMDSFYVQDQLTSDYRGRLNRWLQKYRDRIINDNMPYEERKALMNSVNPKYVLRNYIAQLAIDRAEQRDFSMVNELLELFRRPYDEQPENEKYAARRPDWARKRLGCSMLSCSS